MKSTVEEIYWNQKHNNHRDLIVHRCETETREAVMWGAKQGRQQVAF